MGYRSESTSNFSSATWYFGVNAFAYASTRMYLASRATTPRNVRATEGSFAASVM
jgi:hypothetical protein